MTKGERIDILNELNTRLVGVESCLAQLEEGEDAKHWHYIATVGAVFKTMMTYLEWYEEEARGRD